MEKSPSGTVPAVERTIRMFDLLANSKRSLTLSEISRRINIPKSSAHRILTVLESEQCVFKSPRTCRYSIGVKLSDFNRAAREGLELREEARPLLSSLMQRTRLTVHMSVLENNQAVLIERLEPVGDASIGTWLGRAMDLHSTACGKALIAFLPPAEFALQIKAKFVQHNNKTIISMLKLKEELARVRECGYARDNEEDELGVQCVGAPIFSRRKVVAAISVVGTNARIPEERVKSLAMEVKQTAAAISARLSPESNNG